MPFLTVYALIINIIQNVTEPRWPFRQLQYIVYLYNFMIAQ